MIPAEVVEGTLVKHSYLGSGYVVESRVYNMGFSFGFGMKVQIRGVDEEKTIWLISDCRVVPSLLSLLLESEEDLDDPR